MGSSIDEMSGLLVLRFLVYTSQSMFLNAITLDPQNNEYVKNLIADFKLDPGNSR